MNPPGFCSVNGKPEASLEDGIRVVDVVTIVAIPLLHAQARERLQAGVPQSEFGAGVDQPIVDVRACSAGTYSS